MARLRPPAPFLRCLFLVVQVVSVAKQKSKGVVMADAGFKASFKGMPLCVSHPRVVVRRVNAEHAYLDVSNHDERFALGDTLLLQPFYSDATTCLHRRVHGYARGAAPGAWVAGDVFDLEDSLGMLA